MNLSAQTSRVLGYFTPYLHAYYSVTMTGIYISTKGLFSGVTFIDLKKAFDTVFLDILIAKLRFYEVEGVELDWFMSA